MNAYQLKNVRILFNLLINVTIIFLMIDLVKRIKILKFVNNLIVKILVKKHVKSMENFVNLMIRDVKKNNANNTIWKIVFQINVYKILKK